MYRQLLSRQYIFAYLNQSLKKIQLESKLNFAFVSFSYKLNRLYFFILFLFRYFVCEDIEHN